MTPILGEIRIFGGRSIPAGWAICDGSLVSIAGNEVLYTLLGTAHGGDGTTTFGLPDLRGRVVVNHGVSGTGTTYTLGVMGGNERTVLTEPDLPAHRHDFSVSGQLGTTTLASNNFLAGPVDPSPVPQTVIFYVNATQTMTILPLLPGSLTPSGGSAAHENRMPFLTISYMIATQGVFPDLTDL